MKYENFWIDQETPYMHHILQMHNSTLIKLIQQKIITHAISQDIIENHNSNDV